jgi:hypothetical protein
VDRVSPTYSIASYAISAFLFDLGSLIVVSKLAFLKDFEVTGDEY